MHPEINKIRQKLATHPWPKYLASVRLNGLRGWADQEVRFPFPVSVVSGENGSGKSTVLKAAAVAYSPPDAATPFYPDTFFPDSAWDTVSNVTLTYTLTEGTRTRELVIRKPTQRWRFPGRPNRFVIFQDVSRTLPLDATAGYAKIARRKAKEISATSLASDLSLYYSSILGRHYSDIKIASTDIDRSRHVGVVTTNASAYSQFHQGAGEDATLDLMMLLQNVPDTSLVIIDEVEASLHPRSQRRLVHFLLWLARTKHIQVIISTHSPYVLDELPLDARVFLQRNVNEVEVMHGVSTHFALNRMDDHSLASQHVYCEDHEASVLVAELLRDQQIDISTIRIMPAGPADVVAILGRLGQEKRMPKPTAAVLDADQPKRIGCISLPGSEAPEREVFRACRAKAMPELASRLGVNEKSLSASIDLTTTTKDHHEWISYLSEMLRMTPLYLWTTMSMVWIKECVTPDAREAFAKALIEQLEENYESTSTDSI